MVGHAPKDRGGRGELRGEGGGHGWPHIMKLNTERQAKTRSTQARQRTCTLADLRVHVKCHQAQGRLKCKDNSPGDGDVIIDCDEYCAAPALFGDAFLCDLCGEGYARSEST